MGTGAGMASLADKGRGTGPSILQHPADTNRAQLNQTMVSAQGIHDL